MSLESMQAGTPEFEWKFARETLEENPDSAFRILRRIQKGKVINLMEDPEMRSILRNGACKDVEDILAVKRHRSQHKEIALAAAEEYVEMGILDLESDSDLFEKLTQPTL